MNTYYEALEWQQARERRSWIDRICEGTRQRVFVHRYLNRNFRVSPGWVIAGCLVVISVTFAPPLFGETQGEVSADSFSANVQVSLGDETNPPEVISEALIEELRSKWRTEAMAGTSDSQLSEDHRMLLVDATSRANWTPLCSYTEEAIGPDQQERQIRHHTFEFTEDTLERLLESDEASEEELGGDSEVEDSFGSESSFDMFSGLRDVMQGVKVVDATDASVTYELPVPIDVMLSNSDSDGGMESRLEKKLMENLRVHLTIDAQKRGPKELWVGVKKPLRLFPGVKLKKMNFTTNFRYLEDIQEFAVDRSATEMSIRAFLVAGFSEIESKTMSDFRCVKKGRHEAETALESL